MATHKLYYFWSFHKLHRTVSNNRMDCQNKYHIARVNFSEKHFAAFSVHNDFFLPDNALLIEVLKLVLNPGKNLKKKPTSKSKL